MSFEFLLDENVLGLTRFLENRVKYRKVGDNGCPSKKAEDHEIVKFAIEHNLIIVTKDIKMIEECQFENGEITQNDLRCTSVGFIELYYRILSST